MKGKLIIISAPSGSGKSTLIARLMDRVPGLHFSVSCTSRPPRGQERDGVDYFFVTPSRFRQLILEDAFLEYEEVYRDRFYGTLKSQVEDQVREGHHVIFDVDVKGGCNIKGYYGKRALSVFIQPPSLQVLRQRLIGRGTDSMEVIQGRLERAEFELGFAPRFDRVIVNDDLEKAASELVSVITDFLNQE